MGKDFLRMGIVRTPADMVGDFLDEAKYPDIQNARGIHFVGSCGKKGNSDCLKSLISNGCQSIKEAQLNQK